MSTSGGKIQGPGGEKKGDTGPCIVMATTDAHTHGHGHSLPIDLAGHRSASIVAVASNPHHQGGLVQLRPVRTFPPGSMTGGTTTATGGIGIGQGGGTVMSGKIIGVGGLGSYSHTHSVAVTSGTGGINTATAPPGSIISVNRSGQNLTILPARLGQTAVATVTGGSSPGISTLQFPRGTILGNVRAGTLTGGSPGQPASITVTPLNSSFGTSIRLAGNNGSWIQASSPQGTFSPMIRPATIQVGRTVRPIDGKVIHIPPHGSVHHVAQIQMVDNKGSIIKPSLSSSPMVRGTLHPTGTNTAGNALTLPFTLRASIPTLHRPQTSNSSASVQVQKVITQPAHGPPIQLVAGPKISQLQTITPIPRLNPVCLTISTPANQTANNTTPVVAMAPRSCPAGTNLIMTPSLVSASNTGPPITKVYPISRELNVNPVMDIVNQHGVAVAVASSATSSTGVTFSLGGGTGSMHTGHIIKAHSLPSGTSAMQMQVSQGNHHLVQVGPIGVQSGSGTVLTTINPTASGLPQTAQSVAINAVAGTPSYYMDHKNLNLSVLHPHGSIHPIALDKRHLGMSLATNFSGGDSKGPLMGLGTPAMILTSAPQQHAVSSSHTLGPLQSHSFAHPVSVGSSTGGSINTLNHQHLITSSAAANLSSLTPQQVSIFTAPVSSKQIATSGQHNQHNVTITMSGVGVPATYTTHLAQGHGGNSGLHSLPPSHLISSKPMLGPLPMTSVNAASILSATLSMNTNGPSGVVGTGASTTTANSVCLTTTNSTATTVTTTSTSTTTAVSTPAQSPSQSQTTKSTLSPRPSILRKREAGMDSHSTPLRAQRNLALNFAGNIGGIGNSLSSNIVSGINPTASASISASASAAVAANKENSLNSSIAGSVGLGPIAGMNYAATGNLSILKKEFQPPNEESSWQSCSSNSSSGSTTLSTTSETAEIQLQQLQMHQHQSVAELNVMGSSSSISLIGFNSSSAVSRSCGTMSNVNSISGTTLNGGVRGGSNTVSVGARVRTVSASKAQIKDIERLKGKTKDDSVSPRKKPRKQQLTTSDLLESASPEISFYQGKKFRKSELLDPKLFEGFTEKLKESLPEVAPPERIVYYIKKPHVSLLESNKIEPRPRLNHFCRYTDVKAKEERRPTINDLANQKNVFHKVTGWKLMHLTRQVDQIVELEMNVVSNFNSLLTKLDAKVGPNSATRDLNRIQELLKGNIQRCKVIRDQMSESRSQVSKIVEHKSRVQDVINKFASKRPIKKRERL